MALALKRQGITNVRPLAGGLEGWLETRVSRRVERALMRPSLPLNDEDCFVVHPVLFSNLSRHKLLELHAGVSSNEAADKSYESY